MAQKPTDFITYSFVCDPDECDTLIEVTCKLTFDFPSGEVRMTCPCGRVMSWVGSTERGNRDEAVVQGTPSGLVRNGYRLRNNGVHFLRRVLRKVTETTR